MKDITAKVTNIFRDIFDDPKLEISPKTSADDIEAWDSLNNINLIVAMEKEFNVKFKLQELQSLGNVGDMIRLIESKI